MSLNDYDAELFEKVGELLDDGELDKDSDAYGIAMKVVHEGHASLSPAQRHVYETKVEALLKRQVPVVDYDPPPEA